MAEFTPRIILRCPDCGARGHIKTLVRSGQRRCYQCGYQGDPKEFEEKANPQKGKK